MHNELKHINYNLLIVLIFLVFISHLNAQEHPPVQIYTPQQYNAENQNWGISQSLDKHIYVANNKGLLKFNGVTWQLFDSPNETVIRSVNVVGERIYIGCYMEFGYWQKNNKGVLEYTSLSRNLTEPLIENEQFWKIIRIDDWMLFQSLDKIYIYNTKTESFKKIKVLF